MATFFTADTHFGHRSVVEKFTPRRPFGSIQEHDEELIRRWNEVVSPRDTIFHLGDFAIGSKLPEQEAIFRRLNGRKILIRGNHDRIGWRLPWAEKYDIREVTVDGTHLVLFHFAMRVWPRSHYGSLHLFGHSHSQLPGNSQSLDVGVDAWDYRPVTLAEIKARMATLPPAFPETGQGPDQEALAECA